MLDIIHIAARASHISPDSAFAGALKEYGTLRTVENGNDLSDDQAADLMREAEVVLTSRSARAVPRSLAHDPGRVRYILHLTGTLRDTIPIDVIRSRIPVTNWGDAPAERIAEGTMALLLAVLKDLRPRTECSGTARPGTLQQLGLVSGMMKGLKLGLYGCGAIGRRFVELARPFGPEILVFDPYAPTLPGSVSRVESLDGLFSDSEAVVILVGLSDQTRGSVTASLLSSLPDNGILINTARGAVVDQDALFAELGSGRLRAGLDVLVDDDYMMDGHEIHTWPNVLLTCHDIANSSWPVRPAGLSNEQLVALENLRRFASGEELRFVMDEKRYSLST